jgi:hypothetical protein
MDELLADEVKAANAEGTPDRKKKPKKLVQQTVATDESGSGTEGTDSDEDVRADLQTLHNQISVLSTAVTKLVDRDLARVPVPELTVRAKKSSGATITELPAAASADERGGKVEVRPTTQTLARDRDLNQLLAAYNKGESSYLSSLGSDGASGASRPAVLGERNKKTYFIHDYISRVQGTLADQEDSLTTSNGVQLTFKRKAKKLDPEEVSTAQWISANSRIFDLLEPSFSVDDKAQYNEYTRQIGDLLQVYTVPSVMCLDHEHRMHVTATGRRWDEVSLHLERFHLRFNCPVAAANAMSNGQTGVAISQSVSKPVSKRSNRPCYAYNTKAGCPYPDSCKYKHKCSERGCGEKHPKHEHEKFRGPAGV